MDLLDEEMFNLVQVGQEEDSRGHSCCSEDAACCDREGCGERVGWMLLYIWMNYCLLGLLINPFPEPLCPALSPQLSLPFIEFPAGHKSSELQVGKQESPAGLVEHSQ